MDISSLTEKINESEKLIDAFRSFFPKFKKIFNKLQPNIVNNLQNLIDKRFDIKKIQLIERLKTFSSGEYESLDEQKKQKRIFQVYELIKQFDNTIIEIKNITSDFAIKDSIHVDSDVSDSIKISSISAENELNRYIINFIKAYQNDLFNDDITWNLLNMLMSNIDHSNIQNSILFIDELYKKYENTTELYAEFIQKVLDENQRNTCLSQFIENLIDKNKTLSLQFNYAGPYNKKGPININIRKFGLVPYKNFSDISELFNEKINNISGLKKLPHPTIILHYNTENPISYNLWNLTNYYRMNKLDLHTDPDMGINEKYVTKMRTIIPEQCGKKKWDFNFEVIKTKKMDDSKYYVLETNNGITYRSLNFYILRDDSSSKPIDSLKLEPLLIYLKLKPLDKKIKYSRISCYHYIITKNSLNRLFYPENKPDLNKILQISESVESNEIVQELKLALEKKIMKRETRGDFKKNMGKIIHDRELSECFEKKIIDMFYKFHKKDNAFAEILSTFLSELYYLKLIFSKELHNEYIKFLDDNINISNEAEMKDKINEMLLNVLRRIITPENNIYQIISYRKNIFAC